MKRAKVGASATTGIKRYHRHHEGEQGNIERRKVRRP
jgi:hypothetical protein